MRPPVIGTRGSRLALWQAGWVSTRLGGDGAGVRIEIIRTDGDVRLDVDLSGPLDRGAFTRELEVALLDGRIDVAVHSLKDLPTALPDGLVLGAVPERAPVSDVLLVRPEAVDDGAVPLRPGARVGTGSPRRRALLQAARPDATSPELFRGNVPTRVEKCVRGEVDAVVLARAGLARLGLDVSPLRAFDLLPDAWLPAPGQGALGLQVRAGDGDVAALLAPLDDPATRDAVDLERGLLTRLEAGCHSALGAWARASPVGMRLSAGALVDGAWRAVAVEGRASELVERAAEALDAAPPAPPPAAWWEPAGPW